MKLKAVSIITILIASLAANSVALAGDQQYISDSVKARISQDLADNFAERMNDVMISSEEEEDPILKPKDQKVIMKALYAGIAGPLSLSGIYITEKSFYQKVGKLLDAGAKYGAIPAAITVGFFRRADLIVGKTRGVEMNFYLDDGKLRVSTYDLNTLNVGLSANLKVGYYVALCFGACTGGDAQGTYIGVDADVVFGVGANIYIEVGVDTTDYRKAKIAGQDFKMSEFYEAKAVYIGAGIDIGFGGGVSFGFTDYNMTSDNEIIDLYSIMNRPDFSTKVKNAFDRDKIFQRLH